MGFSLLTSIPGVHVNLWDYFEIVRKNRRLNVTYSTTKSGCEGLNLKFRASGCRFALWASAPKLSCSPPKKFKLSRVKFSHWLAKEDLGLRVKGFKGFTGSGGKLRGLGVTFGVTLNLTVAAP